MNDWISVKEKLPNDFRVIVPISGIFISIAYFIGGNFYRDFDVSTKRGIDEIDSVTHWMPLPKLPFQTK